MLLFYCPRSNLIDVYSVKEKDNDLKPLCREKTTLLMLSSKTTANGTLCSGVVVVLLNTTVHPTWGGLANVGEVWIWWLMDKIISFIAKLHIHITVEVWSLGKEERPHCVRSTRKTDIPI